MRKIITMTALLLTMVFSAQAAVIARWDFEDAAKRAIVGTTVGSADISLYTPDEGSGTISLVGGPLFAGWTVSTTSAPAYSQGYFNTWDNGMDTKYWQVKVSTTSYENITVSSMQKSSNSGPKEFKLQYSSDAATWSNVDETTIIVANDQWVSGVVVDKALPASCNGLANLYVRWVMASNVSANGAIVSSGGTSRIDNIIIKGTGGSSINSNNTANSAVVISAYPNPFNPTTAISFNLPTALNGQLSVYNAMGEKIANLFSGAFKAGVNNFNFNAANLNSGVYYCKLTAGTQSYTQKMVLTK